jgi:tripartite-type tricarboxylate transporter receptor subunit TctC
MPGFAAAGPTEVPARRAAQGVEDNRRQPVGMDNRPGAAGNIATAFVARAPAMVERFAADNTRTAPSSPETLAAPGQRSCRILGNAIRATSIRVDA